MNSAFRARRILAVWEQQNVPGLEAELRLTQQAYAAADGAHAEEQERLELLDGIAVQMQQDLNGVAVVDGAGERAETWLGLLEHLAARRPRLAIRPEKLSFFPCSQSVRRISACR